MLCKKVFPIYTIELSCIEMQTARLDEKFVAMVVALGPADLVPGGRVAWEGEPGEDET